MRSRFSVFAVLLALVSVACEGLYEVPEQVYLIKEGKHQSQVLGGLPTDGYRVLKQSTLSFTARFDESARYEISKRNQGDINKLMGFSDANSLHHNNSIRFGWRYNSVKDKVEIFGYQYASGKRNYEHIRDVNIGDTEVYRIDLMENEYLLSVGGEGLLTMPRANRKKVGVYYMLFPYFGGDEVAPHDIKIYVKESFDH